MGKVYDHTDHSWGFIVVCDPDPRVDEPPGSGEGAVLDVDFEHVYATASDRHWRRCQVCPRTVCLADPHIRAFVYLEGDATLGGTCVTAFFCSRECWYAWAARS